LKFEVSENLSVAWFLTNVNSG